MRCASSNWAKCWRQKSGRTISCTLLGTCQRRRTDSEVRRGQFESSQETLGRRGRVLGNEHRLQVQEKARASQRFCAERNTRLSAHLDHVHIQEGLARLPESDGRDLEDDNLPQEREVHRPVRRTEECDDVGSVRGKRWSELSIHVTMQRRETYRTMTPNQERRKRKTGLRRARYPAEKANECTIGSPNDPGTADSRDKMRPCRGIWNRSKELLRDQYAAPTMTVRGGCSQCPEATWGGTPPARALARRRPDRERCWTGERQCSAR